MTVAELQTAALECEQLERVARDQADTWRQLSADPMAPAFEARRADEHASILARSAERYRICRWALALVLAQRADG